MCTLWCNFFFFLSIELADQFGTVWLARLGCVDYDELY